MLNSVHLSRLDLRLSENMVTKDVIEPPREKTNNLHMRKQRRRSALQ